ncbi:MAG: NAD-dependent epimerase/dehydratase family protein [Acidobacteria bacterium]|nr:NAD-dependent epimerase/dehydratase family protein [Acidobacteriota bacterium]
MILLTGATGYLGSQIAREINGRKMPLRVLVRDPARLPMSTAASPCEVAVGDITDLAALRTALKGVEQLIHTAALVKMWVRDPREFWRINVAGFQNLLQTAVNSGVQRIIYTSSFIALGPSDYATGDESLVHRGPYSNEYEQTKAEALDWLRAQEDKYPVVTLLPGVMYGPGPKTEGNLVGGMVDQYLAGEFPGLLGDGNQRWSFAYNADVVAAHLAALEKGMTGQQYILAGDNRSLNDFFRVLGELTGVRRPPRHLPFWAGKIAGGVEVMRASMFGHKPQLTPGVAETFKHDWVYSGAKAAAELGYHVTPLEEGLRKTVGDLVE